MNDEWKKRIEEKERKDSEYRQWLESLQPGEQFAIELRAGYATAPYRVITVERLTASQIICTTGERFCRKEGYERGSKHYKKAEPVTDQIIESIRVSKVKNWWRATLGVSHTVKQPPVEVIEKMKAIYDEWRAEDAKATSQA